MKFGKRTGTHILINERTAERIVSCVEVEGQDVLEIGPGRGALTKFIRGYKTLYLIELQRDLEPYLRAKFPDAKLIIGDALKVEWPKFDIFISNLPYNISTPLLERLQEEEFRRGVITVQREVAERILAGPGSKDYSRLSVGMQLRFHVEKCFDIPPSEFRPEPKVYSTVIRVEPSGIKIPEGFDDFLRKVFSTRRKMLSTIFGDSSLPRKRGEEFSPDELLKLYSKINGQLS